MDTRPDESTALKQREQFDRAFDRTLVTMWTEKQYLQFGRRTRQYPRRSGELIRSTTYLPLKADPQYLHVTFRQQFLEYGIYVEAGTGREVYRGNPGDIGREKKRKPKPWFNRKYFLSVMNLREFYAENIGLQTVSMIADALDSRKLRQSVTTRPLPTSIPGTGLPG